MWDVRIEKSVKLYDKQNFHPKTRTTITSFIKPPESQALHIATHLYFIHHAVCTK
jgi:hypothetical protein